MQTFVYYRSDRGYVPFGANDAGIPTEFWESLPMGNKLAIMNDMKEVHELESLRRLSLRRKRDLHHYALRIVIGGKLYRYRIPRWMNWLAQPLANRARTIYEGAQ
jgi:hypothetical protein